MARGKPSKATVKKQLKKIKVKAEKTLKQVDAAQPEELAALSGAVHTAAAFVDFNHNC